MSDRFSTTMTIEELLTYIVKCPKQFKHELPDKLEKYIKVRQDEALKKYDAHLNSNRDLNVGVHSHEEIEAAMSKLKNSPLIPIQSPDERKTLRTDMALKILGNQNIHITTTPEHLAEYVVSLTDALLDELDKTP